MNYLHSGKSSRDGIFIKVPREISITAVVEKTVIQGRSLDLHNSLQIKNMVYVSKIGRGKKTHCFFKKQGNFVWIQGMNKLLFADMTLSGA